MRVRLLLPVLKTEEIKTVEHSILINLEEPGRGSHGNGGLPCAPVHPSVSGGNPGAAALRCRGHSAPSLIGQERHVR